MVGINIMRDRWMCLDGVDEASKIKIKLRFLNFNLGVLRLYRQGVQARIH